jgi:hypothetical protein
MWIQSQDSFGEFLSFTSYSGLPAYTYLGTYLVVKAVGQSKRQDLQGKARSR